MSANLHKLASASEIAVSRDGARDRAVSASAGCNRPNRVAPDRRVQLVLILIEEHSNRQLTLREMATVVGLSPWRLAHLFKMQVGIAPQQYLTQIRLTKAEHELKTTFRSIKEIAASIGFPSVSSFTNSFKNAVGITPAQYRRLPSTSQPQRKDFAIARSANK